MIDNYTDHAANERTFLAWVRTAISIVGFGLVTARLNSVSAPFWSEALMLGVGCLVILLAYFRMRHVRKRIADKLSRDDSAVWADTLLLGTVAALFALLALFVIHVG